VRQQLQQFIVIELEQLAWGEFIDLEHGLGLEVRSDQRRHGNGAGLA
jgi:hypothetical protein